MPLWDWWGSRLEAAEAESPSVLCCRDSWKKTCFGGETFSTAYIPRVKGRPEVMPVTRRAYGSKKPERHTQGSLLRLQGSHFSIHTRLSSGMAVLLPFTDWGQTHFHSSREASTFHASQGVATNPRLDWPWIFKVEAALARGRRKQSLDIICDTEQPLLRAPVKQERKAMLGKIKKKKKALK